MSSTVDRSLFVLPNESPVCLLDCTDAFKGLTDQEKKYAHYISKASFDGALSVFLQVSPESPAIFYVLYHLFKAEPIETLKQKALTVGFSEDEWTALLVYTAGFYANSGNYKGFGDSKIVPHVETSKITELVKTSAASSIPGVVEAWSAVEAVVGSLDQGQIQLGYGEEGVTCYHSDNVTQEDANKIGRFFKAYNMEQWNTRLFKENCDGKVVYRVKVASSEVGASKEHAFEDSTVIIERGDYAPIMGLVQKWLKKATESAANDNQKKMLLKYVEHFGNGEISAHKDGSRYWIKDVGPAIESYIGFIENYRDPAGTRSEFEGFVAAVNKETSKKFQALVSRAEEILKRLPWGAAYEKDAFLKPDFTALDVIAFGSSGIPSGINIPNYDDIRQK
ncbi:unnamed protein product [Caenorhabditis auriculariae]|uniref:Dipeptidyl peptidase 3 n=1 Tax=Caenorhabditis auriculariae TaxID=2777116 RepID=A0A8S1GTD5_9PELO|nr:unnamed protein product [Caenorhabditis auriculariae]